MYTLTAAVRDNMGAIIFTDKGSVIEILEDKYDFISNIDILPEEETEYLIMQFRVAHHLLPMPSF